MIVRSLPIASGSIRISRKVISPLMNAKTPLRNHFKASWHGWKGQMLIFALTSITSTLPGDFFQPKFIHFTAQLKTK